MIEQTEVQIVLRIDPRSRTTASICLIRRPVLHRTIASLAFGSTRVDHQTTQESTGQESTGQERTGIVRFRCRSKRVRQLSQPHRQRFGLSCLFSIDSIVFRTRVHYPAHEVCDDSTTNCPRPFCVFRMLDADVCGLRPRKPRYPMADRASQTSTRLSRSD